MTTKIIIVSYPVKIMFLVIIGETAANKIQYFRLSNNHWVRTLAICSVKLPSNKIFQHGAFTGTLPAHYGNLWQVQGTPKSDGCKSILKLVHDGYKIFHSMVTHLEAFISVPMIRNKLKTRL